MFSRSIFVSSRRIVSLVFVSGYLFWLTVRSLSEVSHSDDYQTSNAFKHVEQFGPLFHILVKFCSTNKIFSKKVALPSEQILGNGNCYTNALRLRNWSRIYFEKGILIHWMVPKKSYEKSWNECFQRKFTFYFCAFLCHLMTPLVSTTTTRTSYSTPFSSPVIITSVLATVAAFNSHCHLLCPLFLYWTFTSLMFPLQWGNCHVTLMVLSLTCMITFVTGPEAIKQLLRQHE